jgi:hypothetical protein
MPARTNRFARMFGPCGASCQTRLASVPSISPGGCASGPRGRLTVAPQWLRATKEKFRRGCGPGWPARSTRPSPAGTMTLYRPIRYIADFVLGVLAGYRGCSVTSCSGRLGGTWASGVDRMGLVAAGGRDSPTMKGSWHDRRRRVSRLRRRPGHPPATLRAVFRRVSATWSTVDQRATGRVEGTPSSTLKPRLTAARQPQGS